MHYTVGHYLNTNRQDIMGPALSRTWYIYGRDLSDNWISEPLNSTLAKEDDTNFHMGRFKHQVYLMALNLDHIKVTKMYLYHGWRRVKCEKTENLITITFSDNEARQAWSECKRSRLGKLYDSTWKKKPQEGYIYAFEKITI